MKTFTIKRSKIWREANSEKFSNRFFQLKNSNLSALIIIGLFFILWQGLSMLYSPLIVPGPALTYQSLVKIVKSDQFFLVILLTLKKLSIGLLGSVTVGSILGVLMGKYLSIKNIFEPIIYFIQATPPILYLMLAMIWFGLDGQATIFIIFIASLPIMAINIEEGLNNIDPKLIELGNIFKFTKMEMIFEIIIPSLKTHFKSGLVIVMGLGWKLVVMGEILSGSRGLGSQINDARINLETNQVFAWGIIIIFLCFLSQKLIARISDFKRLRRKNYDLKNK